VDTDQELKLIEAIRHGDNAQDTDTALKALAKRHYPLVRLIHNRRGRFLDDDELKQIAFIEVWKCAQRFDASKGVKFATYLYEAIANTLAKTFNSRLRVVQADEEIAFDVTVPDGCYGDDPAKAQTATDSVERLFSILTEQERAFATLLMTMNQSEAARSMGLTRQRGSLLTQQIARKAHERMWREER
jgi:RNA polymerase sigma factor (sigma-70 family)